MFRLLFQFQGLSLLFHSSTHSLYPLIHNLLLNNKPLSLSYKLHNYCITKPRKSLHTPGDPQGAGATIATTTSTITTTNTTEPAKAPQNQQIIATSHNSLIFTNYHYPQQQPNQPQQDRKKQTANPSTVTPSAAQKLKIAAIAAK